jgi:hypothetical protein
MAYSSIPYIINVTYIQCNVNSYFHLFVIILVLTSGFEPDLKDPQSFVLTANTKPEW